MNNEIKIFESQQFGKIRTSIIDGEPWFVAADVCRCIGVGNPSSVIRKLENEEKRKFEIETTGGIQTLNFVNKNGLISIICSSRKKDAKHLKDWIINSVFPALNLKWCLDGIYQQEIICESSELSVYNSTKFGSVRVKRDEDNEPWFVSTDVCRILSLADTSQAMERIDNEDKRVFNGIRTANNTLSAWCVNEAGLYSLIMESNKPEAKEFKRWVTHEVIPAIRKHGAYMTPDTIERVLTDPDTIIKLATELKTEREKRRLAESDNARLSPLAEYAEKVLHTGNLLTTTQIAKDYGMSCANFNKLLSGLKIQYKVGGQWVLYAQYAGNGYTKDCTALYDNDKQSNTYTKWTPAGRKFLFEKLKDNGIYPDYQSDN